MGECSSLLQQLEGPSSQCPDWWSQLLRHSSHSWCGPALTPSVLLRSGPILLSYSCPLALVELMLEANCPGAFLSKKCTPFIWHSGTVCYWEHTGMGRGLSSPVWGATGTHFLFAPVEEKGLGAPPWGHDGTSARAMDSPHPGSCSPQALPLGLLHSTPSVGSGCYMHSVLFCTLQQHTDPKDKMGN